MDWKKLDALSRRQHGVLALADAAAVGTKPKALSDYARRHKWLRPYPGVLIVPGAPHTFQQACRIAVAAAGGARVLVSRLAAAYLLGMTTTQPKELGLVVPADRHVALAGLELPLGGCRVTVWRSSTLLRSDVRRRSGIPMTSPARTIIDLAAVLDVDDLRSLVIDGRQRRIVILAEIRRIHGRVSSYPGRPKVTRVLADLDEQDCDSRLEWDFRVEARRRRLLPFPRPFPFRCSDGVTIEIDVAFPEAWVAGECDGYGSHSQRSDLTRHHKRQNRAVADGWRPFLIDWTRLKKDPDGLFAELAALLATPPDLPPAPMGDPDRVDPRLRSRHRH